MNSSQDLMSLISKSPAATIDLPALKGEQFGKTVFSIQTDVTTVLKIFEIDSRVQREINSSRIGSLVNYIFSSLETGSMYFPPFILSARKHGKFVSEESLYKIDLGNKIIVLDGQHRIQALKEAIKRLEALESPLLPFLESYPLSIQVYYDLSLEQEQQLFSDINSKSTRVGANLIKMYTHDDPAVQLMKKVIHGHPSISPEAFETRKDLTRSKLMTALNVYKIIAALDGGRIIDNATRYEYDLQRENEILDQTNYFLSLLIDFAPEHYLNRSKSIYLNQGVLIGMALTAHDVPQEQWKSSLFSYYFGVYDWSQTNDELAKKGLPYDRNKQKYRLTPPEKVSRIVYETFKQKLVLGGVLHD